jgi:glycosyltransferase involved in cell wall biosynthesis
LEEYPKFFIREIECNKGFFSNTIKCAKEISKIIRDEDIDIFHDTFGSNWLLFLLKDQFAGVKFISSFYCLNAWRIKNVWSEKSIFQKLSDKSLALMYYGAWTEKIVSRRADKVVLQADGLAHRLADTARIRQSKITTLSNAIDTSAWNYKRNRSEREEDIRIIFFGVASKSRGAYIIIESLMKARERGLPVKLTLVGGMEDRDRKHIEDTITGKGMLDHVSFVGRVDPKQIQSLLASSDIFLYQSVNDGSPRTVLEAFTTGIPIIASRHPGIIHLDENEKYIHFTEFGDIDKIVKQIEDFSIHKDAWIRQARMGREYVVNNFDCRVIARQYGVLYKSFAK